MQNESFHFTMGEIRNRDVNEMIMLCLVMLYNCNGNQVNDHVRTKGKIDEKHHCLRFWFWGRITTRMKNKYLPQELIKMYHPVSYVIYFHFTLLIYEVLVHSETSVDFVASWFFVKHSKSKPFQLWRPSYGSDWVTTAVRSLLLEATSFGFHKWNPISKVYNSLSLHIFMLSHQMIQIAQG